MTYSYNNSILGDYLTPSGNNLIVENHIIISSGSINSTVIGNIIPSSGYFTNLFSSGVAVSTSGHSHLSSDITDFSIAVSGLIPVSNFTSLSGISGIIVTNSGTNYFVSLSDPTIQLSDITDLSNNAKIFLLTSSSDNLKTLISDETGSGILVFNNSPAFSGTPTVPTAPSGTNTTQIASTAFVRTEISNLIDSAPSTLDTLNELAAALGDDPNFATTIANTLAGKANLSGAIFTGPVTIPSGTGNFDSLTVNGTNVSVSGHTHTSSNITDFNSSVSGLLPVKDILSGTYISVGSSSGIYTISATGLQPSGNYSVVGHTHTSSEITDFNSSVSGLLPSVTGTGYVTSSFTGNIYTIGVTGLQPSGNYSLVGHTHTSSDITDFNSAVSGLIPVKNILSGTGITVYNASGIYTIEATGSGIVSDQAKSLVTTVFNKTGAPIPKMTAVYINGGQGDMPTVQLAIATSDMTSASTYGLAYEAIPNMESGQVIVFGALTGLNTDQFNPTAPTGNVNGSVIYLSPSISGALTITKPSAPNHIVAIGTIVRTHQNEGVIEVRVQNGFELEELHNVAISGVTNGQFLQYNSGTQLWVPSSSGNFSILQVNGTGVSLNGHGHSSSDITDFNSSVSGLLPVKDILAGTNITIATSSGIYTISSSGGGGGTTITDYGNNRLLTSDGTSTGIIAESGLFYDSTTSNLSVVYDTNAGNTGSSAMLKLDAYDNSNNAAVGSRIQFSRFGGTQSSPSGVSTNDTLGVIRTNTVDVNGVNRTVARILVQADGAPSGVNVYAPSKITFNTTSGPEQLDNTLVLYSDGKLYNNGYLQINQTNNRLDPSPNSGKNSAIGAYVVPSGLLGSADPNQPHTIYGIASNLSPRSPNSHHTMYYYGNIASVYSELPSGVANSGAIYGSVAGAWRNARGANVGGGWYDDNGTLSQLLGSVINYGHSIGQSGIYGPAPTGVNPYTANAYGLYIAPQKGYGTINTAYDLLIADTNYNTGTINNHYGIYQIGNRSNYLGGSLTIDNGLSAPTNILNHSGNMSGNIAVNYDIDRQIQYFSINGITNFTKGTGWTTGTKSVDVIIAITVFTTQTIAFDSNFVKEWYNPLPVFTANTTINGITAGRYLVLLRSIGNYVQGHYIGNVTNSY